MPAAMECQAIENEPDTPEHTENYTFKHINIL